MFTITNQLEIKYDSKEFMNKILNITIPEDKIAIWHLGQNGYILRSQKGPTILIDPYLTDSCGTDKDGNKTSKSRFLPVLLKPEDLKVDMILLTHSHRDHTDIQTLKRIPNIQDIKYICPFQVFNVLKTLNIREEQIQVIHPKETIILKNITITGTFSLPTDSTDLNHIGFILEYPNGKKYYNTGDTAYTELLSYISEFHIDLMSICINGGYNNLSHFEAAKLSKLINPKIVTPSHYDVMPHNYQPPEVFNGSLKTLKTECVYKLINHYESFIF